MRVGNPNADHPCISGTMVSLAIAHCGANHSLWNFRAIKRLCSFGTNRQRGTTFYHRIRTSVSRWHLCHIANRIRYEEHLHETVFPGKAFGMLQQCLAQLSDSTTAIPSQTVPRPYSHSDHRNRSCLSHCLFA